MSNDKNFDVLDAYSAGWAKGDAVKIYNLLADSYTFKGFPNMTPVDKENFMTFFFTFRSKVEDMGGPKAVSRDFMVQTNVILREVD